MSNEDAQGGSLQSRRRTSLKNAYKARGHKNSNMWLVYSQKTDRDWVITSDLHLVHWLYFLEFNRSVKTFDLTPDPISLPPPHATKLIKYNTVTFKDGHQELHEIRVGARSQEDIDHLTQVARTNFDNQKVNYEAFCEEQLRESAQVAVRMFTALGFAAAIRGENHHPETTALAAIVHQVREGTIKELLDFLPSFLPQVILGILIRFTVSGTICLDMSTRGLGYQTRWRLYDGQI